MFKLKTPGRRIYLELIFSFIAFLFLIPQPYLTVPELDASWQVTLEEAFFKGWEFGGAINFTGGPLSFLYSPTSLGYYVYTQIFAESIILLTSLFLIFRALRDQPFWHSTLTLLSIIPCVAIGKDALYLISITAGAFVLLKSPDRTFLTTLIPAFLAVLALMKFTFASLAMVSVLILSIRLISQSELKQAALIAGSFSGSFLLIWILIGQSAAAIPSFFINSLHISQGYLWNMHLQQEPWILAYLLFLMVITSLPIFLAVLHRRKTADAWVKLAMAAAAIYISWKAGTTRGGTHVSIFMLTATIIAFYIQPLVTSRKLSNAWVALLTLTYSVGLIGAFPQGPKLIAERVPRVLAHNLKFLVSPSTLNHNYTRLIPVVLSQRALPNFQERIQGGAVDILHYQQAIALLNPFNFQPRPTVQNYPAYNQPLCQLNLNHIQTTPPDFIIVKSDTVDARYPYSDDSLYNFEVFQNYRPTIKEQDYLLLERREKPISITTHFVALEDTVNHGESVEISEWKDDLLWLQVDYQPSFWHRLFAFFYKPEMLYIKVTLEDDSEEFFRLVGGNLPIGFLLNPLMVSDSDLETFLNSHTPETKIKEFSIHTAPGHTLFNTRSYGIKLSVLKSEATP